MTETQDMGGVSQAHDVGPTRPATMQWDPAQMKRDIDFLSGDWQTFYDHLPDREEPFLYSADGRRPLAFNELRAFIIDPKNDVAGMGREDRFCLAWPSGPELAVAYLTFAIRCTIAPLNLHLQASEFEFEFEDLPAKGLMVHGLVGLSEEEKLSTGYAITAARKKKVAIILQMTPHPEVAGLFQWEKHAAGKPLKGAQLGPPLASVKREHICLVLHTSGTTKKPKIVPITHESMAVGGLCHAAADLLGPEDVFINTMPMFHIAGLMENLLMTAFSGGRFVALQGQYRVNVFYENMLKDPRPTCYSAVPTHHLSLINFATEMSAAGKPFQSRLKMIRNDSAALVPSLAEEMEEFTGATVMPAYSMTESNPLTSNPRYGARKLKSVGPSVGPDMVLLEAFPSNTRVGPGEEGEVAVKGACVMKGYEMRPHMDKDPNEETFTDGYMRSGDKGWVDEDGYLYLMGRFKELINRGGEKVSPFEVEDAVRGHPSVKDTLCFSCPHNMFGECVSVVVVLNEGCELKAFDLRKWLLTNKLLQDKWLPEVVVRMKDLPKGPTGKPARINLARKLGLEQQEGGVKDIDHPGF